MVQPAPRMTRAPLKKRSVVLITGSAGEAV